MDAEEKRKRRMDMPIKVGEALGGLRDQSLSQTMNVKGEVVPISN
jgi:hypothetical protein